MREAVPLAREDGGPNEWSRFFACLRAVVARVGSGAWLGLGMLATVCFGLSAVGIPFVVGVVALGVLFARACAAARADFLALLTLMSLGLAPFVASQFIGAVLASAEIVAPAGPWCAAAVAGWVAFPLLSGPAQVTRREDDRWGAVVRGITAAAARRNRWGPAATAATGIGLGLVLVAPQRLLTGTPDFVTSLPTSWSSWHAALAFDALALASLPLTLLVPVISAALAEHDDRLLTGPVGPPRSPALATLPLFAAVALVTGATLGTPPRAHEPLPMGYEIARVGPLLRMDLVVYLERGALTVATERSSVRTRVRGPRSAIEMGVTTSGTPTRFGLFFRRPDGSAVVSWIDENGRREDDVLLRRLTSRWDPMAIALLAGMLLGAAMLQVLRPGQLHRLTRPSRHVTLGTLELDHGTLGWRRGQRTVLDGPARFHSADGNTVLTVARRSLVLGLGELPVSGVRVALVSPSAPASMSLREGAVTMPADAALVGLADPVDTTLSAAMHRSAVAPLAVITMLATALCVHLMLAL